MLSGLTLGGMYALSAIGLSLLWGALGMLNMAHGSMLAIGGYLCYAIFTYFNLPIYLAIPLAIALSAFVGFMIYIMIIKHMFRHPSFETNVIIATIGLAIVSENVILKQFGAYPYKQPLSVEGGFRIGDIFVPYQNLVIMGCSTILVAIVGLVLAKTRMGRAIRAIAINKDAALLMGVPVGIIYAQVMAISGALAAVSGVMLSSITTLSPNMGDSPMIKAFIIVAVAGLGNVFGAFYVAIGLGMLEAFLQFTLGVRFAFPIMLLLVILALIWRPYGFFGSKTIMRN